MSCLEFENHDGEEYWGRLYGTTTFTGSAQLPSARVRSGSNREAMQSGQMPWLNRELVCRAMYPSTESQ